MQRFFVTPEQRREDEVLFNGDQADQMIKVLRIKPEEKVIVLDNTGWEYEVAITVIKKNSVFGNITGRKFLVNNPQTKVKLFISPLRRDNFEWVLQKCTELGVYSFTPTICSRTVVNLGDWSGKSQRWSRIIQEASEQSTRTMMPELHSPIKFSEAFDLTSPLCDINLIAWERERDNSITSFINKIDTKLNYRSVKLMIGPEGGFSDEEIFRAKENKISTFSLGKRILRSETAAIVASSLILHYSGDL